MSRCARAVNRQLGACLYRGQLSVFGLVWGLGAREHHIVRSPTPFSV